MKFIKSFWMRMIPVFLMVVATVLLSIAVYMEMMEAEMESCWERLEVATNSTSDKIQTRLNDNISFLRAVSDSYILTNNMENTEEVGKYLNSVMERTIFERIDVILPDNSLITQSGEIVEREGIMSYDELVAKGTHVSGRRKSSFTGREVICCVTPIEEEGKVLGLLVGTIDCMALAEIFEVFTYGGDAQIFLVDCEDGNYIIDNWHDSLGNIYDMGVRKSADGKGTVDMVPAIINREKARFAYISATNGDKSYQYCTPVETFNWELCVVVQEDIAFAKAHKLNNVLFSVAIIEVIIVSIYMAWNIWLTIVVSKSEEKSKLLEYDKIKNEARSKFISNMSHDIRTPLNGIVGMLRIIKNHRDDEKKVDDCLRKIEISTQYLSTLANDMLDINEIENNKLILQEDAVDLNWLAEELSVMLEPRAHSVGVEYYMDCSELKQPYVIGSSIHIKRILVNLIGNAIKYSREAGKKVWVTIKDEEIQNDTNRRKYIFVIKDNGIGMSEEFQKNMYNAFEQESVTARSDYQGYGLGLTIVNYLVKKMGGEIELKSEKGLGSTFVVSIPFKVNIKEENTTRITEEVIDLTGVNVLIVEDNEFNMEIAEVILTDAGANVHTATNGKIAVDMFASSKQDTYDVILMDIMMPIMDGCEATAIIRAMDRKDAKKIPIIAMTASTFSEEIRRCKESGMNSHIAKPLDVNKLMTEIVKYSRKAIDTRRKNDGTI